MTAQTAAAPSMLSSAEQRSAARQLTLAMLALGLLALGLVWRWLSPEQTGVSQLLLGFASLLVAVPVMRSAWYSLRYPSLHGITDQLIALAMLGAWATGDLLTAALLPIIMIFGHVLEERSVIGSQEAIHALGQLTRSHARKIQADGSVVEVDNGTLKAGDLVEVRAGDRVPADGRVLSGQASLDTASITGESVPIEAGVGMPVFGGAINLDGLLRIEVTRTGNESTLGKVIALMQSAERSKPPITRLLERYAGSYMVLVLLLAAVTWFVTNDAQAMLAVLVAACPCALVLSAPATAIAGLALDGEFLAWLLLADSIKPEARFALSELRELGLGRQLLLTGDRQSVAHTLARDVGISDVEAQALPEDKLNRVLKEIGSGFRPMVVGDGINDSLALKAGVVGVAMGAGGADIALASADIVLIGSDLRRLGTCVRLSRQCRQTLQVNVIIGLGWTLAIVAFAAFGWLGAAGAMIAALLHNLSTLLVLGNAGRLLRFQEPLLKLKDEV